MKNVFLSFFFLTLSATSLLAQLEKGDWMLSGDNYFYAYGFEPDYLGGIRMRETLGLMLSDRLMLGADFTIGGSRFLFVDKERRRNYWTVINPFLRYNLKMKEKSILFTELNIYFRKTGSRINGEDFNINKTRKININIGYQYFITPNLALEAIMGTKIAEKSNFRQNPENPERFYINIGFRTFLKTPFEQTEYLYKNYLKTGNYLITGSGFFRPSFANNINLFRESNTSEFLPQRGFKLGLTPSIQYFKTDHWLVGGGIDLGLLVTGAGYRFNAGLDMNTSLYIPLKTRLYLQPTIGLSYSRTVVNADKLMAGPLIGSPRSIVKNKESKHSIKFPMSLGLTCFIGKRTILSNGFLLDISFFESSTLTNNNYVRGGIFSKFEYFFAPNVAIYGVLKHTFQVKPLERIFFDESSRFDPNFFIFSFGFSFFIFKK